MKTFFKILISYIIINSVAFAAPPENTATGKPLVDQKMTTQPAPIIYFPEDTVYRFEKALGVDSLIRLINQRINAGENYLIQNIDRSVPDDLSVIELLMITEHFKLNKNLIKTNRDKYGEFFYNLYDIRLGKTAQCEAVLDSLRDSGINLADSFQNDVVNEFGQRMLIAFCDKFKFPSNIYDLLYSSCATQNIEYKIHMYWKFTALNLKCNDEVINTKSYSKKMFDELYPTNNLKSYYFLDTVHKITDTIPLLIKTSESNMQTPADMSAFAKKYNPLRMLAYALYANDVNLKIHSDELMYLLDAQKKDGSWSVAKMFNNDDSNLRATIYGLWSLCEFREKLKQTGR